MNHIAIQSIATVTAVSISIFAAVFAWQQVELTRNHNRKSVTPILQITPYMEGKNHRNGLYLTNDGLGPAVIKSFSVRSGGILAKGFESDRWGEILSAKNLNPTCFATGWPKSEVAIRPGIEITLLSLTNAEGMDICRLDLLKLIAGSPIEIDVEYESIYGEVKHLQANSKISSKTIDNLYKLISKDQ